VSRLKPVNVFEVRLFADAERSVLKYSGIDWTCKAAFFCVNLDPVWVVQDARFPARIAFDPALSDVKAD